MTANQITDALAAIEAGKKAWALGITPVASDEFARAANLAESGLSSEPNEQLELARYEALRLWGHTLTPWEQASHLAQVIEEALQSRTGAGRQVICELHIEQGDAWGQVGGWKDALACFERALAEAVEQDNPEAQKLAVARIALAQNYL